MVVNHYSCISQNIESETEEKLEGAQVVAASVSSAGVRIGGDDAGEDKVAGEKAP